jgi:photosystem II stability/assembly factor-like uncharacterized protein
MLETSSLRLFWDVVMPNIHHRFTFQNQERTSIFMHRKRHVLHFLLGCCVALSSPLSLLAQFPGAAQTPAPPPPINQSDDPLLKKFVFRAIGPASMGGRIDDFAVVESNPSTYYVAFATGGLWKTINNGTTFEPIFDTYSTSSIGDVAVCQSDPNIVWVGTGEPNNRQSSTFGDGVYKSTDAGKTFTNVGLKETQSIARVVIDPKDANTVYVAALGHLFGPNKERGIYKTTDGGKNWTNVKFIDEYTGFTDLVIDPGDNKTLYAASYQRLRTAFGFNGGGPGTGLWKTTDAGKNWTKIEGNGLPENMLGRIGIDVARSNPNILYAQIEVGAEMGTGVPAESAAGQTGAQGGQGGGGGFGGQQNRPPDPKRSGLWRSDDKGKTWKFMSNENNRPMYYSQVRVDPTNPEIVYTGGLNFSRSTDGGNTFKNLSGVAHSDHHAIWIDPKDNKHVMVGNDGGLDVSYDQGETFDFINTIPAAQFYAVSADMRKPYYVCGGLQDNGSWCGPSSTRAGGGNGGGGGGSPSGITNADWYRVGGGDGFYTLQDPTDYTVVYYESQNGATSRLDLKTGQSRSIRPRAAQRPRNTGPMGGAPAAATVTPAPPVPVTQAGQEQMPAIRRLPNQPAATEAGAQGGDQQAQMMAMMAQMSGGAFGNPLQSNIVPAPPQGETYRFNWSTPIMLSPHNPRTIYLAANKLFRSLDRGDTWTAVSGDLTKQIDRTKQSIMGVAGNQPMASKHDGYANNSNITVIGESPVLPGVLWVGTDDGNVHVSKDGGVNWTNVVGNMSGAPNGYVQISRVEPSHFDAGTCYVTMDNHRNDDWKPYVFVTKDYGATWTAITNNLPAFGNVNVIREDAKNKDLLFVGTEIGVFVSLNGGKEWKRFMTGLPMVRVDDLIIHPRDNDLIVGTHGRGIYICDDISPLQQLNDKTLAADVHLFDVRPGTNWLTDVALSRYVGGQKMFRGANAPAGTAISYHLKAAPSGEVKLTISDITGKIVRTIPATKEVGLNRVQWNLRGDPPARMGAMMGGGGNAGQTANSPAATAGAAPATAGGGQGGGGGFGGRFANFGPALEPGVYLVKLSVDGKDLTTKLTIEADTNK